MDNNYWTSLVRGLCQLFLIISILVSLFLGLFMIGEGEAGTAFMFIMCVPILSIISVSTIMMLSEISLKLSEIESRLEGHSNNDSSSDSSNDNYNESEQNETIDDCEENHEEDDDSEPTWICYCGEWNSADNDYCEFCGRKRGHE